jgi:WD40 repeat protein
VRLPDGRHLLGIARLDGTVCLWDPSTGQPVGDLPSDHTDDYVRALAAVPLPDGRTLLATASKNGTVRLWDTEGHCHFVLPCVGTCWDLAGSQSADCTTLYAAVGSSIAAVVLNPGSFGRPA